MGGKNMADIQEYRGIRGLVCAEVTTDTTEAFECGVPFAVAGVAELSRTTETTSEPHYYDNVPAIVIESTGSDEVTITASAVPFDVLAKITGQTYDAEKGMFVEGERESKYFAIGYITEKTDGTEIFVWRMKGKFNIPDSTHATKDDGAEANGQELTFTGINTTHRFTAIGNKTAKAVNVDTSVNPVVEADFFGEVQTPDTVQKTV
jgi:phi13 family phage major tail protein